MNEAIIFMDESGKTGSERYDGTKWNFQQQPYFTLCAVVVPSDQLSAFEQGVSDVKRKYQIQNEIKSSNKTIKKHCDQINPALPKNYTKVMV